MNPNFSEGLQKMYREILLQQHNIAYDSMIAAFAAAAENEALLSGQLLPPSYSLDSDIPREEIEGKIEALVVKNLRDNLKQLETNLNGLHGKKFGFREVIEMASIHPAYPTSPGTSLVKRTRTSSLASSMDLSSASTNGENGNESKRSRIEDETATTFDDSNASSHDGELQIDLGETSSAALEAEPTKDIRMKEEAAEPARQIDDADGDDSGMASSGTSDEVYKPSKLRIERMRNIQKKKPKFNIENLDLTYHSNMARTFPGSDLRTDDQQARRDKNTLAARISRTKNKAYERMLVQQSKDATSANICMKRRIACLRVYASALMKANGFPESNINQMWEANIKDILCSFQ